MENNSGWHKESVRHSIASKKGWMNRKKQSSGRKIFLYHGTSEENAKQIEKQGFVFGRKFNWKVKSKKGFVYLSSAYAPFYAMSTGKKRLALIKCEVSENDLYPEDDFLMGCLGKPVYTQSELDKVDFERYKFLWRESLKYLGNVAVKPSRIRIIGVTYFDGRRLLFKCDPVISPLNFKIMGDYYKDLSDWIFAGNDIMRFRNAF